jgi:hypothetical protein
MHEVVQLVEMALVNQFQGPRISDKRLERVDGGLSPSMLCPSRSYEDIYSKYRLLY